jgi:hypothetical protein
MLNYFSLQLQNRGFIIHYRCDDEKTQNSWVGATSWYQCIAPSSQNLSFLVNRYANSELWISIFQAINELKAPKIRICCSNSLVLRSWGWDLTIVGGQPKTPIVASIVYGFNKKLNKALIWVTWSQANDSSCFFRKALWPSEKLQTYLLIQHLKTPNFDWKV